MKDWEEEFSGIDLVVQADKWLDYRMNNKTILLMCEIDGLRETIRDLLNGELQNDECIYCAEPDLEFCFHTSVGKYMSFEIGFWDHRGCMTANKLVLYFNENDLKILLCYLDLITGKIKEEDEEVQDLIKQGFMY
jgi:hypothetical protein